VSEVADLVKRREAQKPENRYCFTCPCGNQAFILRPDAKIQCTKCDVISPRLIWGEFFRSDMINPPDHEQEPPT
jgi:hypothetical protein